MKNDILDVLVYLLENHYFDQHNQLIKNKNAIENELLNNGFNYSDIERTFSWFYKLQATMVSMSYTPFQSSAPRIYHPSESFKIHPRARKLLYRLEQEGAIDASTREVVIDQAMALEDPIVFVHQIKWIIFFVLLHQKGNAEDLSWIQEYIISDYTCIAN